jgi:hypothetical protein
MSIFTNLIILFLLSACGIKNTVSVQSDSPRIQNTTASADGAYSSGSTLEFSLKFSEIVTVTGNPRIPLIIGTGTVYADYFTGSGTNSLIFRYTINPADSDPDGIVMGPIDLNAGSIKDFVSFEAILNYVAPDTSAIILNSNALGVTTITAPADGHYTTGQNLDLVVNFNQAVNVVGTPQMSMTIGATNVTADYQSGSGTTALTFRYTVAATNLDTDGVATTSPLLLNSGTIKNSFGNNATLTFTPPTTTGVRVDTIAPTISSVSAPAATTYHETENIDFSVVFSESVLVTGSPSISLTVGAAAKSAVYASGSGTNTLVFRYTVVNGDNDSNGIANASPMVLNGGTIKDAATNSLFSLNFTPPDTSTVLVHAIDPYITAVTAPANATYSPGATLNFSVTFSDNVTVTGTPRLAVVLGSGTVYANYFSGSTSKTLVFRYTTLIGNSDTDGITLAALGLNSGTIKNSAAIDAVLTYTAIDTSGIMIDSGAPVISSITPPANARYNTGQNVDFVVNFNQSVIVSSVPRIAITAQSGTIYADYLSGGGTSALTFRYVVTTNDYDANGIVLVSPIQTPNVSVIQDVTMSINAILTYTLPNTSSIVIDGIDPVISSVTPPANGWYLLASNLDFVVNYSSAVTVTGTPQISMTTGATNVTADYQSGSGTTALTFRYTVAATNLDTDGVATTSPLLLNSGTIKDSFGDNATLTFTSPTTTGVKVDTIAPTISSVSAPADATYTTNQNMDFSVVFSESVVVTGSPSISMTVGATAKSAIYTSGSGTNTLVFRYTVAIGDLDSNGIANASPLVLNGGTIKDAATNSLASLTFTPPATAGVLVDATTVISSLISPASSTYKTSNNVNFIVNFTNTVTVTGTPRLQLNIGGVTAYANYFSGSTTSSLTFRYTVASGDRDLDGLALSSPLSLNSGTIVDSSSTNVSLTFTPPDTSGVLIDGLSPLISSVTPAADKTYANGETLDFSVAYNYNVLVTGTPRIQLTVGATTLYATYISGSGTSTLVFRYTVGGTDLDTDGVSTIGPNLDLNSGTIKDEFGDNAGLAFTAANYPNKKIDGVRPTVSSMAVSANKTYITGENIDFTATYSEAVTISGVPRLSLNAGITSRYATYSSGSGTNTIVFRYTVQAGDFDDNGIGLATLIDLNSGSISDANANAQTTLSFTAPTLTGVLVGGVDPTIISINPPASQTYISGAQLDFTVNFSENVTITGTPTLSLNVGATTVQASYVSGSGTSAIVFRYNVLADHYDADGVATASPLLLAGGTIKSIISTANANLTFTGSVQTGVIIDADVPRISSITLPANFAYQYGHGTATRQYLQFTVNIDKAVTVTGTPRLIMTIGPNTTAYANYVSAGSTSTALIFKYDVASTDIDLDGISFGNSNNFDLNGGTIKGSTIANDLDPALGTNTMTKIFVALGSMRNWYNFSDSSTITTALSGANIKSISDKIGTNSLTHTQENGVAYSSSGFNGNPAIGYATCQTSSAVDGISYFSSLTAVPTAKTVISVHTSPSLTETADTPLYMFYTNGSNSANIRFFTTNKIRTGITAKVFRSVTNVWTAESAEFVNYVTYGATEAIAVTYTAPPTSNVNFRLCQSSGRIAESFLFSTEPTVAQMVLIQSYLNSRYGIMFKP